MALSGCASANTNGMAGSSRGRKEATLAHKYLSIVYQAYLIKELFISICVTPKA